MTDAVSAGLGAPNGRGPNWIVLADRWLSAQFGLWGALRQCRWIHWWSAAGEFGLTLIFAVLPLLVPFVALPMFGIAYSPGDLWQKQINHGELYLLSTALLAPIYYFTFPQHKNGAQAVRFFPSQQILLLIFIGTICVSVLAIAATKVQADGAVIPIDMINFSVNLFIFCCVTYFLTLAVKNSLPDSAERSFDEESRREQTEIPPAGGIIADGPPVDADDLVRDVIAEYTSREAQND